ncbi:MAG: hypothetical protein HYT93_04950 [Parcubacteria group bacterium]|nr:hypothetical protein [Parcubacteria group bacterium]
MGKELQFVKKKHGGRFRARGVPEWYHLARVSNVLEIVLRRTKEGNPKERRTIVAAALGHDVLEDTDATEEEIVKIFGKKGLTLILGMTNRWGDGEKKRYVRQVVSAPEGVRLIKLSDLYDNITSVVYNLDTLGLSWTHSYFLPIVTPMRKAILKTKFSHFKKTAEILKSMVNISAELLLLEIKRYEHTKIEKHK